LEFFVVFFDGCGGPLRDEDYFRESPLEMRIADFGVTAFDFLAGGFSFHVDEATIGREMTGRLEARDRVNLVEDGQR